MPSGMINFKRLFIVIHQSTDLRCGKYSESKDICTIAYTTNQIKMALIKLQINNKAYESDVEADTPLLWVLRDNLGLLGTKYGCGIAQCGACTVHVNGEAARSCILPVGSLGDAQILTIEGLSENGDHPVQQAWDEVDVAQCGYCQAGQIMQAAALLKKNPQPSEADISSAMTGNICRCGTYHRIKEAVKVAAKKR